MDARHTFDMATATRCDPPAAFRAPQAWTDVLINDNAPLVHKVARQVFHRVSKSIPMEDLIQIGQVALIGAARTFVDRGTAVFTTYATVRIRGAMIDELRRSATISRGALRQRRAFDKAKTDLRSSLGRQPTDAEMASTVDMAVSAYRSALSSMQSIEYRSLDDEYSDTSSFFADLAPAADEALDQKRRQAAIASVIAELPEREQVILQLFFIDECTLEDISKIFNVGPSRICQIKKSAMKKLRDRLADWR